MTTASHIPVLLEETIDVLAPALGGDGAFCVDATLGLGGHAEALLSRFPHLRLIGLDRDEKALDLAASRLAGFGERFEAIHCRYDQIADVLADRGITAVDAILADLGVSSMQLDDAGRGFAYMRDADLDMRMDTSTGPTAADLLRTTSEADLIGILRRWGEEKQAGRIARAIIRARTATPITRTGQLSDLIIRALGNPGGGHPAKRTFQALRIAVNDEIGSLERFLPAAVGLVAVGGRIAILAYHSLEDRLVKSAFAAGATSSAPPDWPVEPETHKPYLRLLTRGARQASDAERAANPRAASVRLRAAERIRPTPAHLKGHR